MTDYGRIPQMEAVNPQKEEKEIFTKPTNDTKQNTTNEESDKKMKLKEHLAKCRAKSIAVRKAKAEEKKKNKKPRGRPKKENMKIEINEEETYDPETHRIEEKEIFKQKEPQVASKNLPPEDPPDDKPPANNNGFDMDKLFERMDKTINERMKAYAPPQQTIPEEKEPPAYFKYMKEMKDHEEMIRADERSRIGKATQQKKMEVLQSSTNKYFNRMPPPQNNFNTQSTNNLWDDLLNPRKKY